MPALDPEPTPAMKRGPRAVVVAGERVELLVEGAVFLPDERALVVADLHLEKGSSYAARGLFLPPYDTIATLNALKTLVDRLNPRLIVSLGDGFHDRTGGERLSDAARARLADIMAGRTFLWITGNHDPVITGDVGGEVVDEHVIRRVVLRHEPRPREALADGEGEMAGHLHPAARVPTRARAVRRRCFIGDERRLILPAFGAYTGGLNVLDPAFRPLFAKRGFTVHLCGDGTIYAFPGRVLMGD